MDSEIYIIDEYSKEHRIRYLDENRVIVQSVRRWKSDPEQEHLSTRDKVHLSMPAKPDVNDLDSWPYTAGLKKEI